jgi:nitrogen-specific signal transduction histidine kinase
MNHLPVCYLCTHDETVARSVLGCLHGTAEVRRADPCERLAAELEQFGPALAIVDLRSGAAVDALAEIRRRCPGAVVVGLVPDREGAPADAGAMGLFAAEPPDIGHERLRSLVRAGLRHVELIEENAMLKANGAASHPHAQACDHAPWTGRSGAGLADLAHALRRFDRPDAMLDNIVEWVANHAMLSRAGIFALSRNGQRFCFRAGLRHLPRTAGLEFAGDSPLVRWMQMHAHIVCRAAAASEGDLATRRMLVHALNDHGAEVLAPLHGRRGVIGWLFAGRRVTGQTLSQADLEELTLLAELVSIVTENSLLHEDVTLQKTRAEAVLHSIPVGIVSAGEDGTVEWFNPAAEANLDVPTGEALGRPVEKLDSRLADLLRRCLAGANDLSAEWTRNASRRILSVGVRRLAHAGTNLGAMGIIRDLTPERQLMEQRAQQERMSYWAEMIAAISHEVRNPLVAINTFAQLLPERYDDPAFREEFAELATREIRRLNGLLEQLQGFATPRPLVCERTDLSAVAAAAAEQAKAGAGKPGVAIELQAPAGLPQVNGDRDALLDAVARVIVNAVEAVAEPSTVTVSVGVEEAAGRTPRRLSVRVCDRGPGIPPAILESVFSPFCTSKPRGIGLGLPIARRVAIEHGGVLEIQTGPGGTTVVFTLPAAGASAETKSNEACAGG